MLRAHLWVHDLIRSVTADALGVAENDRLAVVPAMAEALRGGPWERSSCGSTDGRHDARDPELIGGKVFRYQDHDATFVEERICSCP